ncbi:MAG: hypothetical protein ACYCWW_10920 [Deltaproteobacteria bacterium]
MSALPTQGASPVWAAPAEAEGRGEVSRRDAAAHVVAALVAIPPDERAFAVAVLRTLDEQHAALRRAKRTMLSVLEDPDVDLVGAVETISDAFSFMDAPDRESALAALVVQDALAVLEER